MQCKKALEEAEGDMEKALLILKKKSTEIAAKKSDREATAGYIAKSGNASKSMLLALKCETDFVAKNEDFTKVAEKLAETAFNEGEEAAKSQSEELISQAVQKLGENIQLGEIVTIEAPVVGSYVHDGRVGVLVGLSKGDESVAKDIAMHIAAMNPEYTTREEVPADAVEKVRALFQEEVVQSGKPADIQEKMLAGKIDTFFKERTLLDQAFIKNPDMTIGKLLDGAGATITKFARVSVA